MAGWLCSLSLLLLHLALHIHTFSIFYQRGFNFIVCPIKLLLSPIVINLFIIYPHTATLFEPLLHWPFEIIVLVCLQILFNQHPMISLFHPSNPRGPVCCGRKIIAGSPMSYTRFEYFINATEPALLNLSLPPGGRINGCVSTASIRL